MITNLIIRGAKVHNLHCIQPSKPADRLYKSQAADGLAFLLYTISGFTCAICLAHFHPEIVLFRLIHHFRLLLRNQAQFRRLEGVRLRHRVFRAVQAVQNQITEERVAR